MPAPRFDKKIFILLSPFAPFYVSMYEGVKETGAVSSIQPPDPDIKDSRSGEFCSKGQKLLQKDCEKKEVMPCAAEKDICSR